MFATWLLVAAVLQADELQKKSVRSASMAACLTAETLDDSHDAHEQVMTWARAKEEERSNARLEKQQQQAGSSRPMPPTTLGALAGCHEHVRWPKDWPEDMRSYSSAASDPTTVDSNLLLESPIRQYTEM